MGSLALVSVAFLAIMGVQTLTQSFKSIKSTYRAFPECKVGVASLASPITSLVVSTPSMCAMSCMLTKTCLSYNICEDGNRFMCHLIPSIKLGRCSDLQTKTGCVYMEKQGSPCQNGGTWNHPVCTCVSGFAGRYCERYIRSCQEGWELGLRVGRLYMVQPFGSRTAYRIYCNLQYAKTAYFFLRKRNPSCTRISYDMTWDKYKHGWGNVSCGEYFVGLETMYQLMKYERFQMHVFGYLNDGTQIEFFYSNFTIHSESLNYRMDYTQGFNVEQRKGDNGLGTERPRDFCTRDRDCGACAMTNRGGWWYSSGCGGHPMTSLPVSFMWPVDGTDKELDQIFLQIEHMAYLD